MHVTEALYKHVRFFFAIIHTIVNAYNVCREGEGLNAVYAFKSCKMGSDVHHENKK